MLRWQTDARYYHATLEKDLFGELTIRTCWGSLHSNRGNGKSIHCADIQELKKKLRGIFRTRKRHGYQLFPLTTSARG